MYSNEIIENNINWLLYSDVRIKQGEDRGAMYGWKDLTTSSYPFIYSEIVGYAITCFSWIHTEKSNYYALNGAHESSKWILKNMKSDLLVAGKLNKYNAFDLKGDIFDQIYSFDNGMILSGLLNLYNIDKDPEDLQAAIRIADALIANFFDKTKMIAILDSSFNPTSYGKGKWSTMSGSYHAKIAMGLLKLFKIKKKSIYKDVSISICDFALMMQEPDGRFRTNDEHDLTYVHPHLYSCEGLLYAGLELQNSRYVESCLKGLEWAIKQMEMNNGSLPRSTKEDIEQSDCMAQLLRLLIICYFELEKRGNPLLSTMIEKLKTGLLGLYVFDDENKSGGFKYQKSTNQICTWCTMFAAQAFSYYKLIEKKNNYLMRDLMEYYI